MDGYSKSIGNSMSEIRSEVSKTRHRKNLSGVLDSKVEGKRARMMWNYGNNEDLYREISPQELPHSA